jgi:hypothetical protein
VIVFDARQASSRVPVIQARLCAEDLMVCADAPVTVTQDRGPGGMPGALGRWADYPLNCDPSTTRARISRGSVLVPIAAFAVA